MRVDPGSGTGPWAPGPMLDDIRRQPEAAAGLLARAPEFAAFAEKHLRPSDGGGLYAFGSGDGWFAARAVATLAGAAAYCPRPTLQLLLEDAPSLGPADRVLAISMSGDVDRTLEAVTAARARGCGVALLTNGQGGRVGALGVPRISLDLPSLAPFLCGTASYVATLVALSLMLAPEDALEGAPEVLAKTLTRSEDAIASWPLMPAAVRLLSVGPDIATADYGAAKLVEVGAAPVWTDDLEEFAHRQFWTAGRGELAVLLAGTPAFAAYADEAAKALAGFGIDVAAVEAPGAPVPSAEFRLTLPGAEQALWPVAAAVPLQLFAYAHGFAAGLDPNRREHLKADELRFRTSRLLTRRSLLGTGQ